MRIDRYAGYAAQEVAWYLDRLREENPLLLQRTAARLGRTGLTDLLDRKGTDLDYLMKLSMRRRSAALVGLEASVRQALLLAGFYRARIAESYLRAGMDTATDPSIDIHPLTMMFRAEVAANQVRDDLPSLWPFLDSDPFGEDLE